MRRSVREAIVGFTLLAAVTGSAGLWFWIKGISLASRQWTIQVRFADAAGLADRSSVTYRGVLVGRVGPVAACLGYGGRGGRVQMGLAGVALNRVQA